MGPALRGTLVASADADARRGLGPPDEGDPARGFDFPVDRQHFPASRFRHVDDPGVPGCLVRMHPDKTRLVYCKDYKRHLDFDQVTFTFCAYMFRPRKAFDKNRKRSYTGFLPAAAPGKLTDMSRKAASWRLHRRTTQTLDDLAED